MHIPDGYLSPQTFIPAWIIMLPFWARASRRLKQTLRMRQVPMLALGAAFSFIIMMFNIPMLGKTSGHAVGAVLIAILLGPWEALVAVSLALAVQALLFGDGGITAFGANCLTMAVIMPFVGWWVYRLVAGASPTGARRRVVAAAIAGYVGLNVSAVATAVLFGIQPLIARDAAGRALFSVYSMQVALPVMAFSHLLLFGVVEAIVTGLVVAYFQRTSPEMLAGSTVRQPSIARKVAVALGVLIVLTPLGLLATGSAWGEWSLDEVRKMAGYLPAGMAKMAHLWRAPFPGYAASGQGSLSPLMAALLYILFALIGVGVLYLIFWGIHRVIARRESHDVTP